MNLVSPQASLCSQRGVLTEEVRANNDNNRPAPPPPVVGDSQHGTQRMLLVYIVCHMVNQKIKASLQGVFS